jgi:hypothetical protein
MTLGTSATMVPGEISTTKHEWAWLAVERGKG